MDEYMVLLRLVHIFAGIVWVGAAWFMTFVLNPTAHALGRDGQAFMRGFSRHSQISRVMMVTSLLTVLAGLLLYYRVSDHFNSDWISSAGGVVLTIGSVAGISEFLFGGMVIGPTAKQLSGLGAEIERGGGPPSTDQSARLNTLQSRLGRTEIVSAVLTIVAVAGMAAARYI